MKEGFRFGLGMMIGLLTPAVVIFIVVGTAVGLRDWILSRRKKGHVSESACSESSKVLVFQADLGNQLMGQMKHRNTMVTESAPGCLYATDEENNLSRTKTRLIYS
jgi:hypothetical protein